MKERYGNKNHSRGKECKGEEYHKSRKRTDERKCQFDCQYLLGRKMINSMGSDSPFLVEMGRKTEPSRS